MLSLPARTQAVLEFFFSSTGRSSFLAVDEAQAEAAIFDQDTLESRQRWLAFRERTQCPGIALSVQQQPVEGAVWVQKPVTPAALLAAAAQIHAGAGRVAPAADVQKHAVQAPSTQDALSTTQHPADAAEVQLAQALAAMPSPASARAGSVPAAVPAPSRVQGPVPSPTKDDLPSVEGVPPQRDRSPRESQPLRAEVAPSADEPSRPAASDVAYPSATRPESAPVMQASPPVVPRAAESASRRGGLGGLIRRFFGGASPSVPSAAPHDAAATPARPTTSAPVTPPPALDTAAPVAQPQVVVRPPALDTALTASPAATAVPPAPSVPPAVEAPAAVSSAEPAREPESAEAGRAPEWPAEAVPVDPLVPTSPATAPTPSSSPSPQPDEPAPSGVRLGGVMAAQAQANEARFCGLAADRSAQELAEDPELRYDPEVHLVSALREAYLVGSKWQVPTQLECSAGRIVVDTTRNLLLCDFDAEQLETLFATPLGRRPKTRTLNRQEQAAIQSHTPNPKGLRRLDDLLWRAGLLTAVGRLPIEADPQRPVYLRHWPNLTRLTAIPHAVRIAAMWSARGASLVDTAATLGIAQRHVIAFYNAASALDLLTDDGSHVRRAQRRVARNRGLLTRLLGWLHR